MKKVLTFVYAFLIIYTAFSAGLWYTDKNYTMMTICLIGSLCWYGCSCITIKCK